MKKAGKGRYIDNVRIERLWRSVTYEDIFLQHYANVNELYAGVTFIITTPNVPIRLWATSPQRLLIIPILNLQRR